MKSGKFLVIAVLLLVMSIAAQVAFAGGSPPPGQITDISRSGCVISVTNSSQSSDYEFYVQLNGLSGSNISSDTFMGSQTTPFTLGADFDETAIGATLYWYNGSSFVSIDFEGGFTDLPAPGECAGETTSSNNADDNPPPFMPGDGRINTQAYATFVVYCEADAIKVFPLNLETAEAQPGFAVALADIPADAPASSTVLASGGGVTVYQLTSGEIMVIGPTVDGKAYAFIFDGCPPTSWTAGMFEGETFTPAESA